MLKLSGVPMSTTDPSESPAHPPKSPALQSTAPLLLWLGVQLGAILLAALQIPLAARYPEPAERLAPQLLLAVQVVAAGMLFPFLLRNWRHAINVAATGLPFQLAAGYLGGLAAREILPASVFVAAWILVLAVWRACLRSLGAQAIGVALAMCLTLGGGILRYLRVEFAPTSAAERTFESASPLLSTLATVEGNPTIAGWLLLAGLLLAGIGTLAVQRFARTRARATPAVA
jgi:hypothetical protein